MAVAVSLDLFILTAYARVPRLITPFNIHIIILMIEELLGAVLAEPLLLRRNFYNGLHRMDTATCAFQKYLDWTFSYLITLQHAVICSDRCLALVKPAWYRGKKIKSGIVVASVTLLYQQAWYLPLFIYDVVKQSGKVGVCWTFVLPSYQIVVRVATGFIPVLFLIVAYPLLFRKVWIRKRNRRIRNIPRKSINVTYIYA